MLCHCIRSGQGVTLITLLQLPSPHPSQYCCLLFWRNLMSAEVTAGTVAVLSCTCSSPASRFCVAVLLYTHACSQPGVPLLYFWAEEGIRELLGSENFSVTLYYSLHSKSIKITLTTNKSKTGISDIFHLCYFLEDNLIGIFNERDRKMNALGGSKYSPTPKK